MKKSKYGKTFLTRPRWWEGDIEKVDKSPWVYGEKDVVPYPDGMDKTRYSGGWGYPLTLLGVINGILIKLGDPFRLTYWVEEDKSITKRRLRKWHGSESFTENTDD